VRTRLLLLINDIFSNWFPNRTGIVQFTVWAGLVLSLVSVLSPSGALADSSLPEATSPRLSVSSQPVSGQCPWANRTVQAGSTPSKLAAEVLAKMTLKEKAKFVVLGNKKGYENMNTGVPRLCIPALTLSDGPDGVANGVHGITQLPASIGVAASFDTALAYTYGSVIGREAKGKGIDVIQGPNLNIARVPEGGRIFEGYGEDPYLVSQLGVADIDGIQSTGTMADAKHFTGYSQETARLLINQEIPVRALQELYLAPFRAAVEEGHVASLMCAYGSVNGVNDCSDKSLYQTLYTNWGFDGFVRSDLDAVPNIPIAFTAGLSMVKPAKPSQLVTAVHDKQLSSSVLNKAVLRVLSQMFTYKLIGGQHSGSIKANVASSVHSKVATQAAEESVVLLKNSGTLPLAQDSNSIAVIGKDAGQAAGHLGGGSANVRAESFVTPLSAIQATVTKNTHISYDSGVPSIRALPGIPWTAYTSGQPLTLVPNPGLFENRIDNAYSGRQPDAATSDIRIALQSNVSPAIATASHPLSTNPDWMNWEATIVPPKTGLYDISLTNDGDCWLSINNKPVLSFNGLHNHSTWDTAVNLVAGHSYHFKLQWFQTGSLRPLLGWEDMSPVINKAVTAARKAKTAIIFASDYNSEGLDRPNLYLPGAQDQLIEAVAAANPHTVVVLNTGGAVFMPWLEHVSAVVEAWYPGQADGTATSAVLFGKINPSGRLPITFPTVSSAAKQLSAQSQWPGKNGTVDYSEDLEVGYRHYEATGDKPLFPFGFGLSYTSFRLAQPTLSTASGTDQITVPVTNTGNRAGTDIVQCYIDYPPGSGEPPHQLRSFARVTLVPGQTQSVTLTLDQATFQLYKDGKFVTPTGTFTAWIGTSSENLPYRLALTP